MATILVIDDAENSREMLGELLAYDYNVVLAGSGAEGLEKASRHLPDLILLDVLMPAMDGYEVLRRLKADPHTASISVIFITGLDRPEDEARSLLLGGSDYITKPFNVPVVHARVALHLRLARHRRQLEELANVDALTGIANRRQFDGFLAAEYRRAQRSGLPMAVAMVDVDYFKQYNDRYGHALGDRALRAVAEVLQAGMRRPGDLAARYGGEEFGLVLADTSPDSAAALCNALCQAVEALGIPHIDSSASDVLTVSIGVACLSPRAHAIDAFVEMADVCLYQAKAGGRNQVIATRA